MSDSRPHLLVIEDHRPNAVLVCDLLRYHGFRVSWAEDGLVGLEMLKQEPPDLILLDLQLPKLDGYTLAGLIKSNGQTSSIPIIALTASTTLGEAERAQKVGCDAYLKKPIDTRQLPKIIRQFL